MLKSCWPDFRSTFFADFSSKYCKSLFCRYLLNQPKISCLHSATSLIFPLHPHPYQKPTHPPFSFLFLFFLFPFSFSPLQLVFFLPLSHISSTTSSLVALLFPPPLFSDTRDSFFLFCFVFTITWRYPAASAKLLVWYLLFQCHRNAIQWMCVSDSGFLEIAVDCCFSSQGAPIVWVNYWGMGGHHLYMAVRLLSGIDLKLRKTKPSEACQIRRLS